MPTLRSPEGREYVTTDPVEIRNLVIGHGYSVVDNGEPATQEADTEDTEQTSEETTPTDG